MARKLVLWKKLVFHEAKFLSDDGSMRRVSQRCYCAFCRTERTVYRKKHLSGVDVALAALGTVLMMLLFFQDFDPRGLLFFAVAVAATEGFIVLRWRISINCSKCGFDPILYKKDPSRAADKVKEYMAERADDPMWVLSPPQLKPIIKKKDATGSRLNTKM